MGLSAFRNKFLATGFYVNTYGKQIVKKYRKNAPSKLEYQKQNVPTFREFIEFVLDQKVTTMNEHWMPVYNLCMPCHINYNIIGRKETMKEDSEIIFENIEIEGKLPVSFVTMGKSSDQ